ncbi:MAG: tol-pal system protein YbgF [Pseudolabrys sp.]
MTRARITLFAALAALLLTSAAAPAQDRGGNFLDNLFNRGESSQPRGAEPALPPPQGRVAQSDPGDPSVRLDRMENALRQLTGTIEQLQYQNQQLQMQLKRMQDDTEYRLQQLGSKGAAPAAPGAPAASPPPAAAAPGRRGDVFDPSQQPNAPGAPRALGQTAAAGPIVNEPPIGAPGGREPGAPLDLSTLSGNAAAEPQPQSPAAAPRNVAAPNTQLATLPPSAKPQDEYDLAYGYVLRKDYALAEQAFKDYLRKFPNERSVPEAQYWLGESLFQQQRYRDAAESFLAVSTKHERSGKAPDALLRLGQSLAALNKKEAACATLAEVERKYPKASAGVKRSVAAEQRRVHC